MYVYFIEDMYTVKSYCIFKEIHVISDTESTRLRNIIVESQ